MNSLPVCHASHRQPVRPFGCLIVDSASIGCRPHHPNNVSPGPIPPRPDRLRLRLPSLADVTSGFVDGSSCHFVALSSARTHVKRKTGQIRPNWVKSGGGYVIQGKYSLILRKYLSCNDLRIPQTKGNDLISDGNQTASNQVVPGICAAFPDYVSACFSISEKMVCDVGPIHR